MGDVPSPSLAQGDRGPRPRSPLARDILLALAIAAAGPVLVPALVKAPQFVRSVEIALDPRAAALRHAVRALAPDLDAAYAARGYKPLWFVDGRTGAEATALLRRLDAADGEGLAPGRYDTPELRAALRRVGRSLTAEASADAALSSAAADYLVDLHRPLPAAQLAFGDPALRFAPAARAQAIEALAGAPTLGPALARATRMNPLYERLRQRLRAYRTAHLGPPNPTEQVLLANLERLRALPPDLGRRYVLVDAAGARLWMVERGAPAQAMRVVVGKPGSQTPLMAGLIRNAVLNPYWNVPPDLLRGRFAPHAAADPAWLSPKVWEVRGDASDQARPLSPSIVDWPAVEAGAQSVWLRQRPGPANMMGAVKFTFPNPLGIYLHDTPHRADFQALDRTRSSGCIRLKAARRLERWLFDGALPAASGQPEQRIALPRPAPVYVTYQTAALLSDGRVTRSPDVYRRDGPLIAQLRADGRLR